MTEIEGCLQTRKNFYAFLYRMYLEEPPRKLAEDLVNKKVPIPDLKSLNDDMIEGFKMLKKFMETSKDVEDVHEKLTDEYTRIFLGPGVPMVPPYESMYIDDVMMGKSLLDVKKVYRKAGIGKSRDYPEPEDHIAFELKFMHWLCEEGLNAGDDGRVKECLTLQKTFMNEHLMRWVPKFCDDVYGNERSDFYKCIAKVTKGFLLLDSELIDELLEDL